MILYTFEEDSPAPASIANGAGIGTNRNATGPITATIEASSPGTRYDFHSLVDQPFTVAFPPSEAFFDGSGASGSVTLAAKGSTLTAILTGPGTWTGTVQGPVTIG